MITRDELIQLYLDSGFIISQYRNCYTIRAPDWVELTDNDKEIQENLMGKKCQIKCNIDYMLFLAVKHKMIKIE